MSETSTVGRPSLPYIIPMLAFLALTSLEGYLPRSSAGQPDATAYALVYTAKVGIVAALAWVCRSTWRDLEPWPGLAAVALAVFLGLAVAALWVGLDGFYPELPFLGKRTGFDPNTLRPAARWPFIAVRLIGLAALVPLLEELFWRSFLVRWLIDPDFTKVPVGRLTPLAATLSAVFFGLEHPEWLPGLITGAIWAWLLWKTKSVSACMVSHAVANLALGLYVLATGDWKFW